MPALRVVLISCILAAAFPAGTAKAAPAEAAPAAASDAAGRVLKPLREARRIVVLGDSITYGGGWVATLACWMETAGIEGMVINMGLSSETVSGLSEAGHAGGRFPRPDLHERLDRVLRVSRPDVVLACYGMNCGIYQPFDAERFRTFQEGIDRLHETVTATGATIVHLTPPIYDQRPDKAGPARGTDYDAVLAHYSAWLLSKRADGWLVIDVHGPMKAACERARASDSAAIFCPDTVHPNAAGHWAITRAVLDGLGVPADWTEEQADPLRPLVTERLNLLRDAYLSAAGHQRPGIRQGLPLDEALPAANRLTDRIRQDLRQTAD
jgi:lysophospholipase L1-like esterase